MPTAQCSCVGQMMARNTRQISNASREFYQCHWTKWRQCPEHCDARSQMHERASRRGERSRAARAHHVSRQWGQVQLLRARSPRHPILCQGDMLVDVVTDQLRPRCTEATVLIFGGPRMNVLVPRYATGLGWLHHQVPPWCKNVRNGRAARLARNTSIKY